jgi:hypothetical protein
LTPGGVGDPATPTAANVIIRIIWINRSAASEGFMFDLLPRA